MKISLITACFDSEHTLPDTLASVRAQDVEDLEYIVVDGGSRDGTMSVVERHGDLVSRSVSEPDEGIYDALNKGIAMATGDVVGFIHADDVLAAPDVLSRVRAAFANGEVDACYGDLEYVSQSAPEKVVRQWRSGDFEPKRLRRGWMPPHPTLYVRREFYDHHGGFDTRYRIAADYDWILRVLGGMRRERVAYLPHTLVRMRLGGVSNRSIRTIARKSWEDFDALRRNRMGGVTALAWKNLSKLSQFATRSAGEPG